MIVIVGASKGLGSELSEVFVEKKLLLISRSKIQLKNKEHLHLSADINNLEFSKITDLIGENMIEGIFFVVGSINEKDNFKLSNKEIQNIFETNFLSVIKLNESFVNSKKLKSNCLICFCSSVTTFLPRGKQVLYCASKSALNSYYYSFKNFIEAEKKAIRTALLILGYMDTQMSLEVKTLLPKKSPREIAKVIYRNFNNLNGVYYIPFYWFFVGLILKFTPHFIKAKLVQMLKI